MIRLATTAGLAVLIAGVGASAQERRPPYTGTPKSWPEETDRNGPSVPPNWPDGTACREILTRLQLQKDKPLTTEGLMLLQAFGAAQCDARQLLITLGIRPKQ